MKIALFWEDKNWHQKGAAENIWLNIDYEQKTFNKITTSYCDTSGPETVTVTKKSDIDDMMMYLVNNGFREV